MSTDDKNQPTTVSLVPTTVAFAVGSVITAIGAYLIMFYNAHGNSF